MKTILSILILGCLVLSAPLCHAEEPMEPKSADQYREDGIAVILPSEWKPFSYVDESGERTGYLLDLWRKWSEVTGISIQLEYQDETASQERMKNKQADVHGGLYYSAVHDEYLDYADSVHSTAAVLAIKDGGPVDCANALYKGKVSVIDDPYFVRVFEGKYPESDKVAYPDAKTAVAAFLNGETEAIAIAYTPLIKMSRDRDVDGELNICRTLIYQDVLAAVQKGETELLTLVNDGMNEIPSQELEEIEGRWFEKEEQPKPRWEMSVVPVVAVLMLVVATVVMWSRRKK